MKVYCSDTMNYKLVYVADQKTSTRVQLYFGYCD